ncbi:MAG TPA: tryptophan--tRNA ligase [Polyangiaceae bacterium]|nr:tryptophan--tRNA ligase [Polyangiaceae bacterium]
MRILSGIQSSGRLHLGNYYGAIRQFIDFQNEEVALYFIANLHALNSVRDAEQMRELTRDVAISYLALGLDPARAILFRQSDVPEHAELFWILGSVVPMADLMNAHSYKDKVARGQSADFGLFAYPILMAADILIYNSDVVPVGQDQRQHLELTRDWASKFNRAYVPGYRPDDPEGLRGGVPGVLRLPEARILETTAVVPGTDGQKMSKSYDNAIELFGSDKAVKKAIMGITTDSTPVEAPKPVEGSALYALLELMAPPGDFAEIDRRWRTGGEGYGVFKKELLDLFHATFDVARARHAELCKDAGSVERVLQDGAARARVLAQETLARVRSATGV